MKKATSQNLVNRTIFTQDNLYAMRGLESNTFDLIYLDPPFNSNKQYSAPIGSEAAGAAFKDTWKLSDVDAFEVQLMENTHPKLAALIKAIGLVNGSADQSYLMMMAPRLIEMRRLLKPVGSLYLHCDPVMSHSLKLMLDAVFDSDSFRNEIVWFYPDTPGRSKKFFAKKHDVILWHTKRNDWFFDGDAVRVPIQEDSVERYKTARVLGGRSYVGGDAATLGKIPEDVWRIPAVKGNSKQATGYPTQKPLALLDRIIKASCPEAGWVLDPFCGCATTCVAAERLKRNWVGIDLSIKAAELVVTRFQNELGLWAKKQGLTHRTDIPTRTQDLVQTPKSELKQRLYGEQAGFCKGCNKHFELRNMHVDHIIPKTRGGHEGDSNKQLLCGHCNSVKGNKSDAYLKSKQVQLQSY